MQQKPAIASMELGFRLNYDDLAEIMEMLYNKFVGTGKAKDHPQVAEMRRRAWVASWRNTLALAGWSEDEFEAITLERVS